MREHGLVDQVNACTATLSKALGSYGGFVACSRDVQSLLVNRSRSFIYSTGLPPASVGGGPAGGTEVIRAEPHLGSRCLRERPRFATPSWISA